MDKKLPLTCPACNHPLVVKRLQCHNCQTAVEGEFALPFITHFNAEELEFIIAFVKSSGSLKKMAGYMNKSYPSVRNYLDDMIEKINTLENEQ